MSESNNNPQGLGESAGIPLGTPVRQALLKGSSR